MSYSNNLEGTLISCKPELPGTVRPSRSHDLGASGQELASGMWVDSFKEGALMDFTFI